MILRRIGRKLREQDWFAVVVEIVAVVFGVFLGLQVSSWNDERQERRDERQILERLHEETVSLLQVTRQEKASVQSREAAVVSAQPVIFSLEPARPLTQDECGGDNYIETVWGRGCVLRGADAEEETAAARVIP